MYILNVSIAMILIGIFSIIFNRIAFSVAITLALGIALQFLNTVKMRTFDSGLETFDLNYILNFKKLKLVTIVNNYGPEVSTISNILLVLLVFTVLITTYISSNKLIEFTNISFRAAVPLRICTIILPALLLYYSVVYLMHRDASVNTLLHHYYSGVMKDVSNHIPHTKRELFSPSNLLDPQKLFWKNGINKKFGPFASFVLGLKYCDTLSVKVKQSSDLILSKSKEEKYKQQDLKQELPDIILVLHESLFDPRQVENPNLKKLKFKFFDDQQYVKSQGFLDVHTFGGGSWISEFEAISGIPTELFQPTGSQPFLSIVTKTYNSLPIYLKHIGYKTLGVYPMDKNFSNAESSYRCLGVDKYYDINDFYDDNIQKSKFAHLRDSYVYNIIDTILTQEEKSDASPTAPVFVVAATISNHGPHKNNFPDKLNLGKAYDSTLVSKMNDYVSRLQKINTDFSQFLHQMMNRDRKTIIINYGDHLPSFEGKTHHLKFTKHRGEQEFYKTFYRIYANFDTNAIDSPDTLDITLLPSAILDLIGQNNSDFFKSSSVIRKECEGRISNCKKLNLLESYKSLILQQIDSSLVDK